jgi:hypothetical protein
LSAVAALAMGIGFTTTMFSIVHGGTRRLPFSDPHELVVAAKTTPRVGSYDYAASVEPIEPAGVLTYVALAGTLGASGSPAPRAPRAGAGAGDGAAAGVGAVEPVGAGNAFGATAATGGESV